VILSPTPPKKSFSSKDQFEKEDEGNIKNIQDKEIPARLRRRGNDQTGGIIISSRSRSSKSYKMGAKSIALVGETKEIWPSLRKKNRRAKQTGFHGEKKRSYMWRPRMSTKRGGGFESIAERADGGEAGDGHEIL